MTCKDCIHYEACKTTASYFGCSTNNSHTFATYELRQEIEKDCADFKDKSRFIELPCKVGDTVYSCLGNAYQVTKMDIKVCSKHITFLLKSGLNGELICNDSDFGKTVFLTKAEAEKALAERKGEQ